MMCCVLSSNFNHTTDIIYTALCVNNINDKPKYTYVTLPFAGAAVARPLWKASIALAALKAVLVVEANNLATISIVYLV